MKRIHLLCVCVVLIFNLSACAKIATNFELSQAEENVQWIEIYNSEQAYSERDITQFRDENSPVAMLEGELLDDCLHALEQLKFEEEKVFFPIPMDGGYDYQGYIMVIVYEDGGYDVVAECGQYAYAVGKDGQGCHKYDHADYGGEKSWTAFVEPYLPE